MTAVLYFMSFILVGGSIGLLPLLITRSTGFWPYLGFVGVLGVAMLFSVLARGLRDCRPWARVATLVMSCIGVFAFPLGTVLFSPFFYVLVKAKHLFAEGAEPANIPEPAPDIDRQAA